MVLFEFMCNKILLIRAVRHLPHLTVGKPFRWSTCVILHANNAILSAFWSSKNVVTLNVHYENRCNWPSAFQCSYHYCVQYLVWLSSKVILITKETLRPSPKYHVILLLFLRQLNASLNPLYPVVVYRWWRSSLWCIYVHRAQRSRNIGSEELFSRTVTKYFHAEFVFFRFNKYPVFDVLDSIPQWTSDSLSEHTYYYSSPILRFSSFFSNAEITLVKWPKGKWINVTTLNDLRVWNGLSRNYRFYKKKTVFTRHPTKQGCNSLLVDCEGIDLRTIWHEKKTLSLQGLKERILDEFRGEK